MRRILVSAVVAVVLFCSVAGTAVAGMDDYCLIPPYVKTDVQPNILIIMDNSKVMGGPIYTWNDTFAVTDPYVNAFMECPSDPDPLNRMALAYIPNHEYKGLFNSGVWYRYSSNQFTPDPNGVFDGNLLNFLTTSQYDLMMGILVGGKSTSRQTNINTLMGYNFSVYPSCGNGTAVVPWDIRVFVYQGTDNNFYACEFKINNNNRGDLTVSDSATYYTLSGYVCGLIKSTPVRPATNYFYPKISSVDHFDFQNYAQDCTGEARKVSFLNHVFSFINGVFDLLASPADAAALKVANPNSGARFSTTLYQAMTSYQCTASGGTGTYSWSAAGLPQGISISSGGLISGTPTSENDTTRGNIAVTITVSDGTHTASQSVIFTVAGSALTITAPTATSNLTDANRGVPYNYQCTASGGHAGYYSWSASGLPSGLSINSSTGLISGTPTASAGTYSVTISLNDGYATKSVTASLTVKETLAIVAPTASLPNASFNQAYTYACQVQGGTGTYAWSASGLPGGLSINPSTGIISGTPTNIGTFSVTITVTSGGYSASKTTTLVVTGVHITWPTDYFLIGDTIYGMAYTSRFRPVATGGTGSYTWSATGLPAGLSINPSEGYIYGTETTYADFYYTAIISVTDGVTSDSVNVTGYNWEPSASLFQIINLSDGQYILGGIIGQQYGGFSVGTFYGDGQNSWTITGLPAGLNYYPDSGLIYGTPTGPAGCSSVTINATNNSGTKSDARTVYLCISDYSAPRITTPATDSSYLPSAAVGIYYNFTPVATGGTLPYTWTAPSGLPAGLSIDSSTGVISGTPTTGGTYSLTIRVTDNALQQASRNAFLMVISGSAPVITAPATGTTLPGATASTGYAGYQCTATGGTGSYTWSASGLPTGLTINPSTGYISGTANQTGTYSPTITVTDSFNRSASVVVSINVANLTFQPNAKSFNVNICASYANDPYNENCSTAAVNNCSSDADCPGQRAGECNNRKCELKQGILQTYWNRARFGVIDFNNSYDPTVDQCLPASNQASFFTSVENALPVGGVTKLVNAENMGVHTYMGDLTGANACDPFAGDANQCRQNFILVLTNGYGADNPPTPGGGTPNVFSSSSTPALPGICQFIRDTSPPTAMPNMAKNACYGYNTDLRADKDGTQKVATYVVKSMGVNSDILNNVAQNSGGKFFDSPDAATLQASIEEALDDIIKRAAAGTAASVLASGEGSGANLVQAVFYPRRRFVNSQTRVDDIIPWVGRLTNFWYYVDPFFANATVREDNGDKILDLRTPSGPPAAGDYITQFHYDASAEQTKATRWGDTNGDGVADTSAFPDIPFESVGGLWEAGLQLWERDIRPGHDPRMIYTTIDDTNPMISFSTGNASSLQPYLQALSSDEASRIISWTRGFDTFCTGTVIPCTRDSDCSSPATCSDTPYRSRTARVDLNGDGDTLDSNVGGCGDESCNETIAKVWKLGDVLNSTPKISSWVQLNAYDKVYGDTSYAAYLATDSTTTANYKNRGMVFAGANDGMLHAFKLGSLALNWSGQTSTQKAKLTGSNLGREVWAFVPKQVLPYLRYLAQTDYGTCHLYSVDLSPYVFDASIAKPAGCSSGDYWNCDRTADSWRTVLIGGMRFGGACRNAGATCNNGTTDCVKTPTMDPVDTTKGLGYSSYFALDITDQNNPQLLWEFSTSTLGFTTSGPAIVRISAKDFSSGTGVAVKSKNGRWFVVLGSGPTGPIDTASRQFMGRSDQDLRLFIFDLMKGPTTGNSWEVDTGIPNAFAGSMLNSTMDVDLDYQDDAVYIPYVKKASDGTWTSGGVGRLLTNSKLTGANEDATALNPSHWVWGKIMDGIGPVTSSVVRLEKQDKSVLWVYFGSGRYYYEKSDQIDDATGQRRLFGVKDPCFSYGSFAPACLDSDVTNDNTLTISALTDVTDVADVPSNPDDAGYKGWYVNLDPASNPDTSVCSGGMYGYLEGNPAAIVCRNYMAERVITDPLATSSGLVFFTTYKPYADLCSLGGKSFIWALKYDTGGTPGALLKGKALVQVSTGSIEQLDLSAAFSGAGSAGGRKSSALEGVPPTAQGLSIIVGPPPVKRVIHMRER
jgi:Tfp pilus tip-associated adhesin PilY1